MPPLKKEQREGRRHSQGIWTEVKKQGNRIEGVWGGWRVRWVGVDRAKKGWKGELYSGDRAEFWGTEPRPQAAPVALTSFLLSLPLLH